VAVTGGGENCMRRSFIICTREGIDPLGDLGVNGRIILKRILMEVGCEDMDYIHLAQDREQWLALMKTVMKSWDSEKGGEFIDQMSRC
jgi:hypothetical protein